MTHSVTEQPASILLRSARRINLTRAVENVVEIVRSIDAELII